MLWTRLALTALMLSASLISFAAYTLFLRNMGASAGVDLLFYAASVPISLSGVAAGVLVYLLPPTFARLARRNQDSTLRMLVSIVVLTTAAAVLFALACLIAGHSSAFWVLWLAFAVTAGLQAISTLQICLAQARGEYLQSAIAPLIAAMSLLAGSVTAITMGREWLLVIGQLTGTIAAVWALGWMLKLKRKANFKRDSLIALAAFAPMRRHVIAITMGTTAFTLFQPIDAALCVQLASGSMAIMSYAQRVLVAVGTAVSLGAYTIAARTSYETLRAGGPGALCRQANRETLRVVAFGLCVWAGYELGGSTLLSVLLSSSAMSGNDISRLVEILGWMLFAVGPMAAMPYLFRVFFSMQAYHKSAALGVSIAPAYGTIGWMLLGRYDILGLAIAYATVWWLALVTAVVWLNRAPQQIRASLADT